MMSKQLMGLAVLLAMMMGACAAPSSIKVTTPAGSTEVTWDPPDLHVNLGPGKCWKVIRTDANNKTLRVDEGNDADVLHPPRGRRSPRSSKFHVRLRKEIQPEAVEVERRLPHPVPLDRVSPIRNAIAS